MTDSNEPEIASLGSCALPVATGDRILLAHGEGARLTRRLIKQVLADALDNEYLRPLADGATLPLIDGHPVMTTDSYVVSPIFFPGGDIGRLAVYGTVNDLAVCGAEPLYLSLGLILEEGLPIETLQRVVGSIREAALACGVKIVTGDTKVVPRGAADKLFINTTGLGRLRPGVDLGVHRVREGDQILISGTIADHGMAILGAREGFELESQVPSDAAPIHELVRLLLDTAIDVHFLRDPTRGGVSATLHEAAEGSGLSMLLEESALPINESVRGACEILGLDPLYVANEGKLLAIVAAEHAKRAVELLRSHATGASATIIGKVVSDRSPRVLVKTPLGLTRILDEPSGSPLPRIC